MDLSVITVTWNSSEYILGQMRSVTKHCAGLDWDQIIVDNASSDDTINLISPNCHPHENGDLPQPVADSRFHSPRCSYGEAGGNDNVAFIRNTHNLGFAKANNQGTKIASGDYILFLNPDMEITSDIKPVLDWWKTQPRVGIVGGKLLNNRGEINLDATPRRFPTILNQLLIFLKIPHIFPKTLNKYLYRDTDFAKIQSVDTVRGAFLFMRRDLYKKLGHAFDERFFAWFEDVDVCRSARHLGFEVIYHSDVTAVDHVGRSFGQRNIFWKQWTFFKSAYLYFKKYANKKI